LPAVVTSFVGATVSFALIFMRIGSLSIARRRRRTFGRCSKRVNAGSFEVRLMFVDFDTSIDVIFVVVCA
jgi:hypothetical protein